MKYPQLSINLEYIYNNAVVIVKKCKEQGIDVVGVTKLCGGSGALAKTMIRAGVKAIGDSRIENLIKLKSFNLSVPLMLLRTPMQSQVSLVVKHAEISLNSELSIIEALNAEAKRQNCIHKIMLMVELGDLREGVMPRKLPVLVRKILKLKNIKLLGLATNLTCFGGVVPTESLLTKLVNYRDKIEEILKVKLPIVSGGNTSSLPLVINKKMPEGCNQLRIGEGILLGVDTITRDPIPELLQNNFILNAEIIEIEYKPSKPKGKLGQNVKGEQPQFADRGNHWRALLAVGNQDVDYTQLSPTDNRLKIIGGSSDHLIVDITPVVNRVKVGDIISFNLTYTGVMNCMTSPYVRKKYTVARE